MGLRQSISPSKVVTNRVPSMGELTEAHNRRVRVEKEKQRAEVGKYAAALIRDLLEREHGDALEKALKTSTEFVGFELDLQELHKKVPTLERMDFLQLLKTCPAARGFDVITDVFMGHWEISSSLRMRFVWKGVHAKTGVRYWQDGSTKWL